MNAKTIFKQYTYYFVIAIVSLFCMIFLPLLSASSVNVGFNYPSDVTGKIVWWSTKIIISGLNVLIFHSFVQQGKVNILEDANFKKANEILSVYKPKDYNPRSPKQYLTKVYGKKGTTVFITSACSVFALTNAIIRYDYVVFFTYIFTIAMGLVFGILQMKKTELYYTTEFLDYALKVEQERKQNGN